MTYPISEKDDFDPLALPDGRIAMIKYCFIRSREKPTIGDLGFFDIERRSVLWSNGTVDECMTFPDISGLCEHVAMLPCGPERARLREQYLRARKCLFRQMVGRVRLSDPAGPATLLGSPDWVIGIEEASSLDFDTATASAGPENWYEQALERNAALGDPVQYGRPDPNPERAELIRDRVVRVPWQTGSHRAPSPISRLFGYFWNR